MAPREWKSQVYSQAPPPPNLLAAGISELTISAGSRTAEGSTTVTTTTATTTTTTTRNAPLGVQQELYEMRVVETRSGEFGDPLGHGDGDARDNESVSAVAP